MRRGPVQSADLDSPAEISPAGADRKIRRFPGRRAEKAGRVQLEARRGDKQVGEATADRAPACGFLFFLPRFSGVSAAY